MQASINRSVARSKEIVYDIVEGERTLFRAVIVENNRLLVLHPELVMSDTNKRTLEKLLTKAKHRDGISDHTVMTGHEMVESGKELLIRPVSQEAIV